MKNIFSLFMMFVIIYSIFVLVPNAYANWQYSDCADIAITEEEAATATSLHNIRYDDSDPRTCNDGNGREYHEVNNIFLPGFLK